jgi:hypothetical protein
MAEPRFHTVPYYTFASPRYRAVKNKQIELIPEDYNRYDSINGTYDKYFPLYAVDENEPPVLELVNEQGQATKMKGLMEFIPFRDKFTYREKGKKNERVNLANSNLEYKKTFYQEHLSIKLNPGWSLIQSNVTTVAGKAKFTPKYIIRALGNNTSTRYNLAVKLPKLKSTESGYAANEFNPGTIVEYNGNLWKCLKPTKLYPPLTVATRNVGDDPTTEEWDNINLVTNVFNADVFIVGGQGIGYLAEINDETRQFNPNKKDGDDTLVAWNLSYYH